MRGPSTIGMGWVMLASVEGFMPYFPGPGRGFLHHHRSSLLHQTNSPVVVGTDRVIWVEDLENTFDGVKYQFRDVSFNVCKGQKLGLVGINGCGKSTILKCLAGVEKSDSGSINSPQGLRKAYVEQEPTFPPGSTVLEVIHAAQTEVMSAIEEYHDSLVAFGEGAKGSEGRFERAMAKMDALDAWSVESSMDQIMSRLRVTQLASQPVESLSGGEAKRVALAAALMSEPDVLLLDEPTNHLDVNAIEWLEDLLLERGNTVLLVTHDRYFLENVCSEILELDMGSMYRYQGSYSAYLEAKDERLKQEASEYANNKNMLRKELAWVRKQPKARQSKSKARVEAFHDLNSRVAQQRQKAATNAAGVTLAAEERRLGGTVMKLKGAELALGGKKLLQDFHYEFAKGERIGIVGGNGVGKTTFLRTLIGEQALDAGEVVIGETVTFGHYSQKGLTEEDMSLRVMELVEDTCAASVDDPQDAARKLLNRFNFPAARWNDQVSRLSGGEKRRLQLLKVLALNPNVLVLDEPTNDLDLVTLGTLEEFLLTEYKGCLLVVSHDRYFMDRIAQHLFVFEGDGVVRDFEGSFTDYLDIRKQIEKDEAARAKAQSATAAETSQSQQAEEAEDEAPKRKLSYSEKIQYGKLEEEIEALGVRQAELQDLLDNSHASGADFSEMNEWSTELGKIAE
ncbi:unnamed protein product, partial [Chrysoparadoxa australica]